MVIDTFLTVLSVAERATHLYDWFTGLSSGRKKAENITKVGSDVVRLSDNLLYAPYFHQAINREGTVSLKDHKHIYDMLNPVTEALSTEMLVGAVNATPERLKKAFKKDPWEVLIDIRPADKTKRPSNPDLIPITFVDREISYIGWQTRGALPILLDCEFDFEGNIMMPPETEPRTNARQGPIISDSTENAIRGRRDISEGTGRKKRTPPLVNPIQLDNQRIKTEISKFLNQSRDNDRIVVGSAAMDAISRQIGQRDMDVWNGVFAYINCSISKNMSAFLAFGMKGIYYKNLQGTFQSDIGFIPYEDYARLKISTGFLPTIYIGNRHLIDVSAAPFDKDNMARFLASIQQIVKNIVA